jgi:GT2 family glycosyltransferase
MNCGENLRKSDLREITVIIVNYRTRAFTQRAVEGLRSFYPETPLLLIDNGSNDDSTKYIASIGDQDPHTRAILNALNRYHGPAMDQGIRHSETRFVFTLDSDCEVQQGGFLEQMLKYFDNPLSYAVGWLVNMDRYGFQKDADARQTLIPYIHPHAMLLDRDKYLSLPPFVHHGSPCLTNMRAAQENGYTVRDFPIAGYVLHYGRGTCSQYGYGLSVKTLLNKVLSTLGI